MRYRPIHACIIAGLLIAGLLSVLYTACITKVNDRIEGDGSPSLFEDQAIYLDSLNDVK